MKESVLFFLSFKVNLNMERLWRLWRNQWFHKHAGWFYCQYNYRLCFCM